MKSIILIGSLFVFLLSSGCYKEEPETTLADEIRYEVLDGKTIEEYKQDYIKERAYTPLEFDGDTIKKELESITNKEDLKEFAYEKALTKEFIFDGDNEEPLTHEETVNMIICNTGYIVLPDIISYTSEFDGNVEEYKKRLDARNALYTIENGFIELSDWESMSLKEAKEHVYKILKNEVDKENKELKDSYDYHTSDEFLDKHISSQIHSKENSAELEKSLQEEVDAIYESQMQKLK